MKSQNSQRALSPISNVDATTSKLCFPIIDVGNRTLRKYVQNIVDLVGTQRRADLIQKGDPRRSEKNMDKGQQLLLAQEKRHFPLLLRIQSVRSGQDLFKIQLPQ